MSTSLFVWKLSRRVVIKISNFIKQIIAPVEGDENTISVEELKAFITTLEAESISSIQVGFNPKTQSYRLTGMNIA